MPERERGVEVWTEHSVMLLEISWVDFHSNRMICIRQDLEVVRILFWAAKYCETFFDCPITCEVLYFILSFEADRLS